MRARIITKSTPEKLTEFCRRGTPDSDPADRQSHLRLSMNITKEEIPKNGNGRYHPLVSEIEAHKNNWKLITDRLDRHAKAVR